MDRRTFLTLSAGTAGVFTLRPATDIFSRSLPRTENQDKDLLIDLVDAAIISGAEYADARLISTRSQTLQLRKDIITLFTDTVDRGIFVQVFKNGGWSGYAINSTDKVNPRKVAAAALEMAKSISRISPVDFISNNRLEFITAAYETPYEKDPFVVPVKEKIEFLRDIILPPLTNPQIPFTVTNLFQNRMEWDFYSSAQTRLHQTFMNLYHNYALTAFSQQPNRMESRTSPREAKAGGWELMQEYSQNELDILADEVVQKLKAETVQEALFDLVVDATVMWDIIADTLLPHLDARRMLQRDGLPPRGRWLDETMIGHVHFAAHALNIYADNTLPGGLATCRWDDAGRPASRAELIRHGRLIAVIGSDEISNLPPHILHTRANSWKQPPQCAMPNVVLQPGEQNTLSQLIENVQNGLLVKGRGSIITNPQRTIARIKPQIGWRIRDGHIGSIVRDFEIEIPVDQLWNSLEHVGDSSTVLTAGELFPDRSYPLWTQPFSISTPAALFRGIPVYPSTGQAS